MVIPLCGADRLRLPAHIAPGVRQPTDMRHPRTCAFAEKLTLRRFFAAPLSSCHKRQDRPKSSYRTGEKNPIENRGALQEGQAVVGPDMEEVECQPLAWKNQEPDEDGQGRVRMWFNRKDNNQWKGRQYGGG